MSAPRLESLMLKDIPVVPPDSVIKTFSHLRGNQVDLVLTQDDDGLAPSSMIVRQGEWAKFFLDSWFDPIYRSYNFQKAEVHALVRRTLIYPSFSRLTKPPTGTGASGTMAPYDPGETGLDPTAYHERI